MVSWKYRISSFSEESGKEICGILEKLGYEAEPNDKRTQGQGISLRKRDKGAEYHLSVVPSKSKIHFNLHLDMGANGYHKSVMGGEGLYKEKSAIIRELKRLMKCARG